MKKADLPLVRWDRVQERSYQINVFEQVKDRNSLVVLPTGLGKTIIAILVLAYRAERGRILFLAPTKPLCEQHAVSISRLTSLEPVVVTGELYGPDQRKEIYRRGEVVVATPQTVENDLDRGVNPGDFSLIVFDEAHRAVGSYAYVGIARRYLRRGSQILGMTASPGSDYKKLREVADHLGIEHVELRTEQDPDVQPYLAQRRMRWVLVDMPEEVKRIVRRLDVMLTDFLAELATYTRQARNLSAGKLSKKVLIDIQSRMRSHLGKRGGSMYKAISVVSAAIKLAHLKDMLTSQGVEAAQSYLAKLEFDRSKAAASIRKHRLYPSIRRDIVTLEAQRPKLEKTRDILLQHLERHPDGRVILFAEYRDTIDFLLRAIQS
ncbi:MAG: DEAD/DEAH box helicase family protein, partial [Thermoplasmatota archaeon]